MPTKRLTTALLITAIFLYMPLANAEIYQWVDGNGMTHFSDKPRKSGPSKVIRKAKVVKKAVQRKAAPKRQVNARKKQAHRVEKSSRVTRPVRARKPVRVPKPIQIKEAVKAARSDQVSKPINLNQPLRVQKKQRFDKVNHAAILHASLNATFYDIEMHAQAEPEPEQPEPTVIINVKQTLCANKRLSLAALQEKGFGSYYDEKGEHRVAWGIEGFYREKRRYLTADEVVIKTKNVQFEVEQYCDKPHDLKLQRKARADWIRAEYCAVSQVILADLKHPFMRTSERDIQNQEKEVERFCSERHSPKDRNDERYYPKKLQIKKLQQKHFLYR